MPPTAHSSHTSRGDVQGKGGPIHNPPPIRSVRGRRPKGSETEGSSTVAHALPCQVPLSAMVSSHEGQLSVAFHKIFGNEGNINVDEDVSALSLPDGMTMEVFMELKSCVAEGRAPAARGAAGSQFARFLSVPGVRTNRPPISNEFAAICAPEPTDKRSIQKPTRSIEVVPLRDTWRDGDSVPAY